MGVQQLSQPPHLVLSAQLLGQSSFHSSFRPEGWCGNCVGSDVVVVPLPPHVPKSSVSPLPLWKWCAHLGTSLFVAAGAQFECVSLPLHSRTAHPPLILGSLPFPSLSPVWSYILLFSALPMKRKGIVARSTVSDRPK